MRGRAEDAAPALPTFHLPGTTALRSRPVPIGGVRLEAAELAPELMRQVLVATKAAADALCWRAAQAADAQGRKWRERVAGALVAAGARWRDPALSERRRAEAVLPAVTRLSPAMVAEVMPLIVRPWSAGEIEGALRAADAVEQAVRTAAGWAAEPLAPRLAVHLVAGNVPGLAVAAVALGLLAGSAVLVKLAQGEPLLGALLARTLADVDAEVGAMAAVAYWPGGEREIEEVAFSAADLVAVTGSNETLAAIRPRVKCRFLGFGSRTSLAAVGREALGDADRLARALARDVALYDQRGCLSPHAVYVERGGAVSPQGFAARLAEALEELEARLPRGPLSAAEHAAVHEERERGRWRAWRGEKVEVIASRTGTAWTVLYDERPQYRPTCGLRTVRVHPLERLEELPRALAAAAGCIEAAAVAGDAERVAVLSRMLGRLGVSRVCAPGRLQEPPLWWPRGGRLPCAELVGWIGVEA